MAKGQIVMPFIIPKANYFLCTIQFKFKSGYTLKNNSLRIYYSTTPEIVPNTGCPYVTINPNDTPQTDENMITKTVVNGWLTIQYRVPGVGTSLTSDTTYWLRSWMQLYKTDGTAYKKYRGPANPTPAKTGPDPVEQKLFEVASFSNPYTGEDDTEYEQTWEDFTKSITLGSYDVNYEDVEEDWVNADYVTRRIVPRQKIKGSLELYFQSKYEYNKFLKLIKINRQVLGPGYTQLRLQVNNDLDMESGTPGIQDNLGTKKSVSYIGNFFMKMENNPHIPEMLYGHYDKYETLRINVEEA